MDIDLAYRPGTGLPLAEQQRIRAAGPILWSDALAGWLVSGYDDVKGVLANPRKFTIKGTSVADLLGGEAMLVDDTPLHNTMRAAWDKSVSLGAMEARADEVKAIASRLLEPFLAQLDRGEPAELVAIFHDFTAEGTTWVMGLPRERAVDLKHWNRKLSDTPVVDMAKDSPAYAEHKRTKAEVIAYLNHEVDVRQQRLRTGATPDDLVAMMASLEGKDGITRTKVIDNVLNFFLGAIDTTSRWLGNVIVFLLHNRSMLDAVREDKSLLPQLIEEVMRLETVPQLLGRLVKEESVVAGRTLQPGERLFVLPGAANRDPATFSDPDRFDLQRHEAPQLGFGIGMHHCLGRNIARAETLALTSLLLDVLPELEIVECDYGPSWALWGPVGLSLRRAA
jgi:cytochrome P450